MSSTIFTTKTSTKICKHPDASASLVVREFILWWLFLLFLLLLFLLWWYFHEHPVKKLRRFLKGTSIYLLFGRKKEFRYEGKFMAFYTHNMSMDDISILMWGLTKFHINLGNHLYWHWAQKKVKVVTYCVHVCLCGFEKLSK